MEKRVLDSNKITLTSIIAKEKLGTRYMKLIIEADNSISAAALKAFMYEGRGSEDLINKITNAFLIAVENKETTQKVIQKNLRKVIYNMS